MGPTKLTVSAADQNQNKNPVGVVQPRTGQFLTPQPLDRSATPVAPSQDPRAVLAAWITAPKNEYFAGAMALMIRYLGVPARVAVGFSSGTYDTHRGVWTVTDHEAHAWVEAWFKGYGWLPFDPTPGAGRPERGQLGAPYSVANSPSS